MRIALIASGFADYSLELAGALAANHTVRVFADRSALLRERGDAPAPAGVTVQPFRQTGPVQRWGGVGPLAAAIAGWRPDAILAHEHAHPHLSWLLRLVRVIAPLGLVVHDPEPHPGRDSDFAHVRKREIAAQRALATHLFTHDAAGADRLARMTGWPVTLLRHGPILRPTAPPGPPAGARRVLMFGRMEAYKGLDILLQAMRRLEASGTPIDLELRGAGPELDRLAAAFRSLKTCTVHPGQAARQDLLAALAACDVVVAPYLQASGSGVAAAALASARGIVASDTGGLAAAVVPGVNGVLAAPGDPQALAQGLIHALNDARSLSNGARALAAGPFSWSPAAAALVDRFAAGEHRRRAS